MRQTPARKRSRIFRACDLPALVGLLATLCLALAPAAAQTASAPASAPSSEYETRALLVGTKEAPPFAMKAEDGSWSGVSIDLWRRIAEERKWRYRFIEEPTVQDLIEGTASGRFDVAVAAITITAERERALDFTSAFYSTGLGIAVTDGGPPSWVPVVKALTSFGFAQAVLALIGLALAVGLLVWLLERRHNEEFGGTVARGLSSSVWWTTVAMTQRGIGNFGPRTLPGRAIAMLWMVGSIIAIAVFTAGITSALTVRKLQGAVHSVADLSTVRVGTVAGTSGETSLAALRVKAKGFPTARDGLIALRAGEIEAFVYDKPLLAWTVNQEFRNSVELLDTVFEPQHYAFAVPPNSPLRKPISVGILENTQGRWWEDNLFRHLGAR
jgi:ABC-type amino acid transport substrate-binding protein